MTRTALRRVALGLMAAPLLLGLAACGDKTDGTAGSAGEPIAAVAPPAGKSWVDVIAKTEDGGYRMGNPEAPLKLIEFASLTCSHCAEFAEASGKELRETFVGSGRVSFEFRNFVRDPFDITAAQLTRCGPPETFFGLTEQVFGYQPQIFEKAQAAGEPAFTAASALPENQRGMAIAGLIGLDEFFAARGVSRDQANACLANSADATALAKATEKYGKDFDITGTPTFVVNGQKVDANAWPELKVILENMGAR